jgi:hypothetical protein
MDSNYDWNPSLREEWSGGGGRSRTYDTADMSRML